MGLTRWWAAAMVLVLGLAGAAKAQNAVGIELPEGITQLVVSSSSGVVAVLQKDKKGVVLYPKLSSEQTLEGALLSPTEGRPLAICHKRLKGGGVFVVADDRQTLHILDDKTGKRRGSIKLDVDLVDVSASPREDDDLVFYSRLDPRRGGVIQSIGRIDVARTKDWGLFEMPNYTDELCIEAATDGRTIYVSKAKNSPCGIRSLRWENENENRLVQTHEEFKSLDRYVPLPEGMGTAIYSEVRSVSLKETTLSLPMPVVGAMRKEPVVFCQGRVPREPMKVLAISLNTGKELGSVALPDTRKAASRPNPPMPRKLKRSAFVDELHENLILQDVGMVVVVPLAALNIPAEPLMAVKLQGPTELICDEPWTAEVVSLDKNMTVSLGAAPAGMKLSGGKLSWTPQPEDVGSARVTFELAAGNLRSQQKIDLAVRQRVFKMPFTVANFAATPDGKKLVVISAETPGRRMDVNNRTSRMAVVDTSTGKILFEQQLDFRVGSLDASNDVVCFGAQQADAVYSLSFANPAQVNRTFTEASVQGVRVAGDRVYVSLDRRHNNALTAAFRLPKMEPIEAASDPLKWTVFNEQFTSLPVDVGAGWRQGEAVWSRDFSKVTMLLDAPFIPAITLVPFTGQQEHLRVAPWGTTVEGGQIRRLGGQVIAGDHEVMGGAILVDLPAAALLRAGRVHDQEAQAHLFVAELGIFDLVSGKETKIPLVKERLDYNRVNPDELRFGRRSVLLSLEGKIFAVIGDRLIVVSTARLKSANFAEPLYFEGQMSDVILSVGKPAQVTYHVKGGVAPLKFSLVQDAPGLSIDPSSGKLTVNSQIFTAEKLNQLVEESLRRLAPPQSQELANPAAKMPNIRDMAEKQIKMVEGWTGKAPAGVPIALKLGVRVRDANQQEAVLNHVILIDVPPDVLQPRLEERVTAMRKANEVRPAIVAAAARQNASAEDVALLKKRLAELELENARLKAQVEVLKEIRQGGPTGSTK